MPTNRHMAKAAADLYASAMVDALNVEGGIDAVLEGRTQLEQVVSYNRTHVDLTDALRDPGYTTEQRSSLVKNVFAGFQPVITEALGVMAERGDIESLPRILEGFNSQISQKLNTTVVDVVTRVPLDDHLRQVIKAKTSADLGQEVVLQEQVDPYLLGGIIMSANGKRIDASVNTMLENARQVLKQTTDGGEEE